VRNQSVHLAADLFRSEGTMSPRTNARVRVRATAIAVAITSFAACQPDLAIAPGSPALRSASAARVSEPTTTVIIPPHSTTVPTAPFGEATAINEDGVVAGWKGGPSISDYSAFIWKDGVLTPLGSNFQPVAINRAGDIAGNIGGNDAVLWRNGVLTPLVGSGGFATAYDMNDKDQIVGFGRPSVGTPSQAFLWDAATFTMLGTLGGTFSVATSVNKHGQVVGYSEIAVGSIVTHAFLWERGVMTDLGTLDGGSSKAFAINDQGEIVGLTDRVGMSPQPFIIRKGVMTPMLANVPMVVFFTIEDISNSGHVVGSRAEFTNDPVAFVWRDGASMDLAGALTHAASVNASGEIAGYEEGGPVGFPGAYFWTVGRHGP
jgi:probable HAF family extracellular repeat protein